MSALPGTIYGGVIVAHDAAAAGWVFRIGQNGVNVELSYPGLASGGAGGTLAINTWYHVAVCRAGTQHYIAVNGTVSTVSITNRTADTSAANQRVGQSATGGAEGYFAGWLDEVRVTQGRALYTANFTPPTAAFPDPA
jgi:Concanavalin A-like lectin/glucanases superfamily